MHFERTTNKTLTRDIYKVCDGEQTRTIIVNIHLKVHGNLKTLSEL